MHTEVTEFLESIKNMFPDYFKGTNVLEGGSLDLNGSARQYFSDSHYVGVDIGPGAGVNAVTPVHLYSTNIVFDVVLSTEMLEHDTYWKLSLQNMYKLLKSGGIMIITCAGPERAEHGTFRTSPKDSPYTNDYYRNIDHNDFFSVLSPDLFKPYEYGYKRGMNDFMFWGIKK